jgi:RimJ/RimL family protein N-acetyltransferase
MGGCPALLAPLPDVTTDRLVLRRFHESDLDELASVFAKPQVWRFPYGRGFTRAETERFLHLQREEWEENGVGCWAAIERSTTRLVGYVGLSVPSFLPEVLPALEVGWRFDPDVWGLGYATEGASAALDEAFSTLGLAEVCSVPQSDNPPSVRVCERLGMRLAREVAIPANQRRRELAAKLFLIAASDWHARRAVTRPTPRHV